MKHNHSSTLYLGEYYSSVIRYPPVMRSLTGVRFPGLPESPWGGGGSHYREISG